MAWFGGKVSLGNLDFSEAVNKLSESVKNIEKNFDNALGLEEKSDDAGRDSEGMQPSATDRKALSEPVMGFMGQQGGESTGESLQKPSSSVPASAIGEKRVEKDNFVHQASGEKPQGEVAKEELKNADVETGFREEPKDTTGEPKDSAAVDHNEAKVVSPSIPVKVSDVKPEDVGQTGSVSNFQEEEKTEKAFPTVLDSTQPTPEKNPQEHDRSEELPSEKNPQEHERSEELPSTPETLQPQSTSVCGVEVSTSVSTTGDAPSLDESADKQIAEKEDNKQVFPHQALDASGESPAEIRETSASDIPDKSRGSSTSDNPDKPRDSEGNSTDSLPVLQNNAVEDAKAAPDMVTPVNDTVAKSVEIKQQLDKEANIKEQYLSTGSNSSDDADSNAELKKVKKEMEMMEAALHGAARQAQAKADEIAKLMSENEQLKAVIDDLKGKTNEAEIESLREEYHLRVSTLERKALPFQYTRKCEINEVLEEINEEMGFPFDEQDLQYYTKLFMEDIKRNPTNVELFDIAQSNSEHLDTAGVDFLLKKLS